MAVIDKSYERKKRKNKLLVFLLIPVLFFVFGKFLHNQGDYFEFFGDLSYLACGTSILVGIVYRILHRVAYVTGEKNRKLEKLIIYFFYIGISSFIIHLISWFIFNDNNYVEISPFSNIYIAIRVCISVGEILFFISLIIIWKKWGKLIKVLKYIFWS